MITVQVAGTESKEIEVEVDEDLKAFDEWFVGLGNAPMVGVERAILKTYLFYKTVGAKKEAADATSSTPQ